MRPDYDIAVIGAGVAGIATAYYLATRFGQRSVVLIDRAQPMSYTSAQSGDNYRNWWPHPTMVQFTTRSIELMERVATESDNALQMTRRGYVLATRRSEIDDLLQELRNGFGARSDRLIRIHTKPSSASYQPPAADWQAAPDGVDVMSNRTLIEQTFPTFSDDIRHVLHVRRAGEIDSQQMAQWMLARFKAAGGERLTARVSEIDAAAAFELSLIGPDGQSQLKAERIVNAAGPGVSEIAAMLGESLPVEHVFQQKVAFVDALAAVPRDAPFVVDLDAQRLNWDPEQRALLAADPATAWLAEPITGGVHCRAQGGPGSHWVKLGWAYNTEPSSPREEFVNEPLFDPNFPEIVLRGAAALQPALAPYWESMPDQWTHYGGYYSMTNENWPVIGPSGPDGAFVVGALSGFGSMAACAAGELCAAWVVGAELPDYASPLSLQRHRDPALMAMLQAASKGVL